MNSDRWFRIFFLFLIALSHPRVQIYLIVTQAKRVLRELEYYKVKGLEISVSTLSRRLEKERLEEARRIIEKYSETFVINPVSIDPVGIVNRLEHLMDTHESFIRAVSRRLVGEDKNLISLTASLISAENALVMIYKILVHLIESASKSGSIIAAYQIQVLLPRLRSLALAYYDALKAFSVVSTIGDSAGPYVARMLSRELNASFEPSEVDPEACVAEAEREDRRVYIIKARGPVSNLANFGRVVYHLASSLRDSLSGIITVDAALKLEGEPTGSVQVGVGAAIGDPGHEKYRIETIATELRVPLMAVIIKQSLAEAVVPMAKPIADGCKKAVEEVKSLIRDLIPEGRSVIVVGVGNTSGVSQDSSELEVPEPKIRVASLPKYERTYKIRTYIEKDGKIFSRAFKPGDYVGKLTEEGLIVEVSAEVPKEISEVGMPLLLTRSAEACSSFFQRRPCSSLKNSLLSVKRLAGCFFFYSYRGERGY